MKIQNIYMPLYGIFTSFDQRLTNLVWSKYDLYHPTPQKLQQNIFAVTALMSHGKSQKKFRVI